MANFQLLSCNIALAGDILNVVARHAFNPVTYPEMLVLRYLHGETAVTDIFDVGYVERDEAEERDRLVGVYGNTTVREKMFPGAGTRIPNGDNNYKPRIEGTKINPGAPPVPDLPDLPTPDATVSMAAVPVPDEAAPDYSGDSGTGTTAYVPPPRASRRPTPVAGNAADTPFAQTPILPAS